MLASVVSVQGVGGATLVVVMIMCVIMIMVIVIIIVIIITTTSTIFFIMKVSKQFHSVYRYSQDALRGFIGQLSYVSVASG